MHKQLSKQTLIQNNNNHKIRWKIIWYKTDNIKWKVTSNWISIKKQNNDLKGLCCCNFKCPSSEISDSQQYLLWWNHNWNNYSATNMDISFSLDQTKVERVLLWIVHATLQTHSKSICSSCNRLITIQIQHLGTQLHMEYSYKSQFRMFKPG